MVTVSISTANERTNIGDCVQSAKLLTDHVMVFDMASTDGTVQEALDSGAEVLKVPPSGYVEPIRQYAIEQALDEWVFILDADERMTAELASEIREVLHKPVGTETQKPTHYRIPRKNIFGTTWLKYGGWYPDRQIRLIQKSAFRDWPKRIHSTPQIEGPEGSLCNPILHYFHGNLTQMVAKTIKYEMIESDLLYGAQRSVSTAIFFRKYMGELFRRLVKLQGFRDGMMGWIESIYQAYSKTITYLFLYEKYRSK